MFVKFLKQNKKRMLIFSTSFHHMMSLALVKKSVHKVFTCEGRKVDEEGQKTRKYNSNTFQPYFHPLFFLETIQL